MSFQYYNIAILSTPCIIYIMSKIKVYHKNVDNILQKGNRIHGSNGYVFCQFLSIHSMYENKKTGEK